MVTNPIEAKFIRTMGFDDYPWDATKKLNKWMRENADLKVLSIDLYSYRGADEQVLSAYTIVYLITQEMHEQEVSAALEWEENRKRMEEAMK